VTHQRIEGGEMLVLLTSATATSDQTDRSHVMKVWGKSDLDKSIAHRSVTHRRDVLLRRPQEIQMNQNREPIAIDTESHINPQE
jgi:hypothetical protein